MCASECMVGEKVATEREQKKEKVPWDYKGKVSPADKSICCVNEPNTHNMTYLLSAFMFQIGTPWELFPKSIIFPIFNSVMLCLFIAILI